MHSETECMTIQLIIESHKQMNRYYICLFMAFFVIQTSIVLIIYPAFSFLDREETRARAKSVPGRKSTIREEITSMRMTKKDFADLYSCTFLKELRDLFRDKVNIWNFNARYNLRMSAYPETERTAAQDVCSDWLFDHFLFAVSEEFLNDRVEFLVYDIEGVDDRVVCVSNGFLQYEFLIEYRDGLNVRHRVIKIEE